MICPVCLGTTTILFQTIDNKDYWSCQQCQVRFLDPERLPAPEEEHAHYLLHENDTNDPHYRNFLEKAASPLLTKLPPGRIGLDYGCGPGPALAAMMKEAGHHMTLYDPYFHNNASALSQNYDFITCTETAEHFHHPAIEFGRLDALLNPGGWLVVMTCFQTDDNIFANWHYRRDPTHVVFYRTATFQWLANHHGWSCEFPDKNVALMQKGQ